MNPKKRIIKYNNIILKFKTLFIFFDMIRNNNMVRYIYNLLIYIFLIILFLYVSRVHIWFEIVGGNLDYLDVLKVLFSSILSLILVAKIISIRSNWKTLFFKYTDAISWKKILGENLFLVCFITFFNSITILMIAFQDAIIFSDFEYNIQLLILIVIKTIFVTIFLFELSFLGLLIIQKSKKTKRGDPDHSLSDPIIFQFTNSKVVLTFVLITSILFAKFTSEQINDFLLGIIALDWELFIISIISTSILFIYFIISLNTLIFKYFKLEYNIDIKNNAGIFLIAIFLFINGVYLSNYIATAIVYVPSEIPDPLFNQMLQQLCTLPGVVSYHDPIIINIMIFFFHLIVSVIFAMIIYLIFLYYTFKKYSPEFKLDLDQIAVGLVHEPLGYRGQKKIIKLFSKSLKNYNFGKRISYLFYMFWFFTSLIFSLAVTYFVVSDSMFGKNTFIIFAFNYQYIVAAYGIFGLVLSGIFEEVQKFHKYQVTDFISKNILYGYIKYSLVYISLTTSCLITINIRNIYQISEKYRDLFAPESIQVVHCVIFLFTSGYILLILSKKTEEILIKEIERETT